jgi:serine protease AprX
MGRSVRRVRWAAYTATAITLAVSALSGSSGVALAKGSTWALRGGTSTAGATRAVIVQAKAGRAAAAEAAVRAAGGTVDAPLPIVNGFSAHVPAGSLAVLRANAAVHAVTENTAVRFAGATYDNGVASNFAKTTGATAAWSQGRLGDGVGVAVIDTGISPMNDLAGHVVYGPDLSGDFSTTDNFGHGTVMGGLIAGSGADSAGNSGGAYVGVAPHAKLVSVKVAGRNGATDVSTMLQAMHWVAAYKDQYNIRVLNISWGTNSTDDPAVDPLNYAVERLWRQGIVVVVSAGNAGSAQGTITKPGDDPVVLTVGAFDDKADLNPNNDAIPAWSSRGPTAQGVNKPDVVAPGRSVTATRSFGSAAEVDNPKALVSPSYIKGSGTSEAAAVTSGVVALLLQSHPTWTPDQVKKALRSTAYQMSGTDNTAQGKGRINYAAANNASPSSSEVQSFRSSGLGPIEPSRGSVHVYSDCQADGTPDMVQGEQDVFCNPWDSGAWVGSSWGGDAWTGATWPDQSWNVGTWDGSSWGGSSWGGSSWGGSSWGGSSWGSSLWGGSQWGGSSWGGSSWGGSSWGGSSWGGSSWGGSSWGGSQWGSSSYGDQFLTAFWGARPRADQHVNGEINAARQVQTQADDRE